MRAKKASGLIFLEKLYWSDFDQKVSKMGYCFLGYLKIFIIWFFWSSSKTKNLITFDMSEQTPYLVKFWFLSYKANFLVMVRYAQFFKHLTNQKFKNLIKRFYIKILMSSIYINSNLNPLAKF